jgi:hypothetical protein
VFCLAALAEAAVDFGFIKSCLLQRKGLNSGLLNQYPIASLEARNRKVQSLPISQTHL